MKKISVNISGHQTSITLEEEFFDALKKFAVKENKPIAAIIRDIDEAREKNSNLSSAIRVWVLKQSTLSD